MYKVLSYYEITYYNIASYEQTPAGALAADARDQLQQPGRREA